MIETDSALSLTGAIYGWQRRSITPVVWGKNW